MKQYGLDFHGEMLLEEYREQLPLFQQLKEVVSVQIQDIIRRSGLTVNTWEARIKTEESLAGKLSRKGGKYGTLSDITDIFGARIITFYNEDVDRIASIVEKVFDVDWSNSADQRKMHEFNSFGYNSLHYICRLPASVCSDAGHPRLNQLRFELQMRTALQHVWSAINHDIGYKSEIETPVEYRRSLSRLAGMLELADEEFSRIRHAIADYRRRVGALVKSGRLEDIDLNADSFQSYLDLQPFDKLNRKIAAITQAEFYKSDQARYLRVLRTLGMTTLGDVEQMIRDNADDAYQLALFQLGSTDIDILADTVGLQNLCIVCTLKKGLGQQGVKQLFELVNGISKQNDFMADIIMEQASRLSFMNQ
jgi:ppGpp synthetase/RelA/SpoT-type nucleotidyltranferase